LAASLLVLWDDCKPIMFSYPRIILQTHWPELQENNFNGVCEASGGTGLQPQFVIMFVIIGGAPNPAPSNPAAPNPTDQFFSLDVLSKLIDS
jgi:hypothetical protein